LSIPFAALTAFFDPGVQFGLQFRGQDGDAKAPASGQIQMMPPTNISAPKEKKADKSAPEAKTSEDKPAAPAEVVSLDAFRKK
jgi:hypothetical protein